MGRGKSTWIIISGAIKMARSAHRWSGSILKHKIESEFSDVKIPDVVLDRVEGALVRAVEEYDQEVGG